jgi:hypothetical protein
VTGLGILAIEHRSHAVMLHRRMNAQQQMRWTPRGAHLMLKGRCAVMNGTFERDHTVAEQRARRPFRRTA